MASTAKWGWVNCRRGCAIAIRVTAVAYALTGVCYSARLIDPFVRVLARDARLDPAALDALGSLDPEARIPIARAHEMLELAVRWAQDPDLGLKAGQLMSAGDCGAVDYAISSAATVRAAIAAATRYARLVNDVISLPLVLEGERAVLRLECETPVPRAAGDFMMAGFFSTHARTWLAAVPALECWFRHPAPADVSEYARTFGGARLRFAAPCYAFAFGQSALDAPLAGADAKLNSVVRDHAEMLLAQRPPARSLTERVRHMLSGELAHGRLTAQQVAMQLRMSRRTLCRKLESEGTSFTALLADLRQRLALHYVGSQDLGLSEIAFLLGFSEAAAFHRAFKRWTGQTPLEYRRSARA
jgi:AraC-like DNA-binding protein